ncbi:MAG TPA: multiheme c-type cytochrome [Blastocatellia bacterium]|nr:multiheme c-type cytochrome [Blastocatellia bacterium]
MPDIPVLAVDTGYFLADERNTHGWLRSDAVIRSHWVLKSQDQFPVDVANISANDLTFLSRMMDKGWRVASEYPVLNRMVSANIKSAAPANNAPPPFVIKEVKERRSGASKATRIAFVGITDPLSEPTPEGFKIGDPFEAARRIVPAANKDSDIVIVLAHVKQELATRIAREVPGIDVIINGLGKPFVAPVTVGSTIIYSTPYESRLLGELRFYRGAGGKLSIKDRYILLNQEVGDDPLALETATAAKQAEDTDRKEAKELFSGWLARTRRATRSRRGQQTATQSKFVSSGACVSCHEPQYIQWNNSAHAHATDKLVSKQVEFERGCFACHTTGLDPVKTASESDLPVMHQVQCEQCHGPGADHIAKPEKGYGKIVDMKAACTACHTPQVNPNFDVRAAWEKIKH